MRIARWGSIDIGWFERPPVRRHKISGVGATQTAVISLPLLEKRIANNGTAEERLITSGGKGTEVHNYRRRRRACAALETEGAQWQSASDLAQGIVHEDATHVVL